MKNLRITAFSFAVLVLTGGAFGQDFKDAPFPDAPKNHWAYAAVDAAFQLVAPVSYFHHRGSEFNSRIKFTQALVHVYSQLAEVEADSLNRARQVQADLSKTDWQKLEYKTILSAHHDRVEAEKNVLRCREAVLTLKRVFNEFQPELKYLQSQDNGSKYHLFESKFRIQQLELQPSTFISADNLAKVRSEESKNVFLELSGHGDNKLAYQLNSICASRIILSPIRDDLKKAKFTEIEMTALIISYHHSLLENLNKLEDRVTNAASLLINANPEDDKSISAFKQEVQKSHKELRDYEHKTVSAMKSLIKLFQIKASEIQRIYKADTDVMIKDIFDCIPRIKVFYSQRQDDFCPHNAS